MIDLIYKTNQSMSSMKTISQKGKTWKQMISSTSNCLFHGYSRKGILGFPALFWLAVTVVILLFAGQQLLPGMFVPAEMYKGVVLDCRYEGKMYSPLGKKCSFNQEYTCKLQEGPICGTAGKCYTWIKTGSCGTPPNDIECHYVADFNCPQERDDMARYLPFGNECQYWCDSEGKHIKWRECLQGGVYGSLTHQIACNPYETCKQEGNNAWCEGINDCEFEGDYYNEGKELCFGDRVYRCEKRPEGYLSWVDAGRGCYIWEEPVVPTIPPEARTCQPFADEWRCSSDQERIEYRECYGDGSAWSQWTTSINCIYDYGEGYKCVPKLKVGVPFVCERTAGTGNWFFDLLMNMVLGVIVSTVLLVILIIVSFFFPPLLLITRFIMRPTTFILAAVVIGLILAVFFTGLTMSAASIVGVI